MVTKAAVSASVSVTAASSSSSKSLINPSHRFLSVKRLSSFNSFSASAFVLAIKWRSISYCSPRSTRTMESYTTRTRASTQPLANADELIDSVETFIFDCDGLHFSLFQFTSHINLLFLLINFNLNYLLIN